MEQKEFNGTFDHLSQRVVFSYLRSLAELTIVIPEGLGPAQAQEMEAAQRDLHGFFQTLYEALYQQADRFGLPIKEDVYVDEDHPETSPDKQEINRRLQKSRDLLAQGLDALMQAGIAGELVGQSLVLQPEAFTACLAKPKTGRKFLQGCEAAGLRLAETKEQVVLSNPLYPAMMPALKLLAERCAQYEAANEGKFHFARCDFRALNAGYITGALDLYRTFNQADYARLAQLHGYFLHTNYKPEVQIYSVAAWRVMYQGSRKVKATPLFQVEFQDRCKNPLQLSLKCASANRITHLLSQQPRSLQEDFVRRSNRCRHEACNWCKNRKGMGPSEFEFDGETISVCWYVNPKVRELNEEAIQLIEQYTQLHEQLH